MNIALRILFTAVALLPFVAMQDPAAKPAPAADPVAGKGDPALLRKLAWLSGTWVLQDGVVTTEEHWRPLQGGMLLGSSHTFDAAKTRAFEHLRIAAINGTIAYLAMPGGKPATAFPLSKLEDGLLEFENAQHDHPQRIRYQRTKDGVTATICQLDGSRAQAFAFRKKD
jgi:hypothetical protein